MARVTQEPCQPMVGKPAVSAIHLALRTMRRRGVEQAPGSPRVSSWITASAGLSGVIASKTAQDRVEGAVARRLVVVGLGLRFEGGDVDALAPMSSRSARLSGQSSKTVSIGMLRFARERGEARPCQPSFSIIDEGCGDELLLR